MPEEKKEETQAGCGSRRCGGCKFLAGVLVGLLIAGTGLGLFLAGRCGSSRMCGMKGHGMCPMSQHQDSPSK